MDSRYNQMDNDGIVRLELQSDRRNGSPVAMPVMSFSDAVAWFCLSQEAFRAELASVGEGESVRNYLGGIDNGKA